MAKELTDFQADVIAEYSNIAHEKHEKGFTINFDIAKQKLAEVLSIVSGANFDPDWTYDFYSVPQDRESIKTLFNEYVAGAEVIQKKCEENAEAHLQKLLFGSKDPIDDFEIKTVNPDQPSVKKNKFQDLCDWRVNNFLSSSWFDSIHSYIDDFDKYSKKSSQNVNESGINKDAILYQMAKYKVCLISSLLAGHSLYNHFDEILEIFRSDKLDSILDREEAYNAFCKFTGLIFDPEEKFPF